MIKLIIAIILICQSHALIGAENYSIEDYYNWLENKIHTSSTVRDYCKMPGNFSTKEGRIIYINCIADIEYESKFSNIITNTKNLWCSYKIEKERGTCVCVNHKKSISYRTKYFKLDKILNEKQCQKANDKVASKREKIKEKCIKKAGKMKTDSAYKDMYRSCINTKIPTRVIN